MPPVQETRRSSRLIVAPLAVVLILAAGWSALWFYTAQTTERLITGWMEREAEAGRLYACPDRSLGGFPFRIEVSCRNPRAEFRATEPPVIVEARGLTALAQVYTPGLVVAEVTGPLTVRGAPGGVYTATWRLLQASLRGDPSNLRRLSLVADDAVLAREPEGPAAPIVTGRRLEMHVRPSETSRTPLAVLDLAVTMQAATFPQVSNVTAKPLDADVTASLGGVDASGSKPLPVRLREWQAAGGRLEITAARVQQADTIVVGSGVLGLSGAGKLDGTIDLRLTGLQPVAAVLFGEANAPRIEAALQAGLLLLGGRAEIEGRRAVAVPLRFSDGAVFLGPVRAGQTPSLF